MRRSLFSLLPRLCFIVCETLSGQTGSIRLEATDPSGTLVPVQGELTGAGGTWRQAFAANASGAFVLGNIPPGDYTLTVSAAGFELETRPLRIEAGAEIGQKIEMRLARVSSSVVVRVLPSSLDGVPGSTAQVIRTELDLLRPLSVKEGLRRMSGVHIVDEDAFGLNLNIGIRGLNPRRTQRSLLLEDGMPVHLAPYGDPSAHYHTPPELIESMEVVKGSGQIAHGPQTVGGMINFVTEPPPTRTRGTLGVQLGDHNYRSFLGKLGTGNERGGILGHFVYRDGDGTRRLHSHQILHGGLSALWKFSGRQYLQWKGNYYEENSRFAEGGISQAAFERDPLSNPFANDRFYLTRFATQGLHGIELGERVRVTTNFYYQKIDRASYRQADFAGDQMTANAATGCVGDARVNYEQFASLCGNKMRPRNYEFVGIDPRLEWRGTLFGMRNETSAGIRYHREDITRKRYNGLTPDAREDSPGVLFRDWNTIRVHAAATYLQSRFLSGNWSFTPGVRLEQVRSRNLVLRRNNVEQNSSLEATQTLALPGIGATYSGLARSTIFAGVHRGFAPPRPDDNFDPLDPLARPVDAERSTNYEAGIRSFPLRRLQIEATVFHIDFINQIVAGETVGLPQFSWANAGKTLNAGAEFSGRYDFADWLPMGHNIFLATAYTRVTTAKFNSSQMSDGVDILGRRLPYAPGHTLSPSIHYQHRTGFNASLSSEHVSRQFADSLNRTTPSADGQTGLIPAYSVLNLAVNVPFGEGKPVAFFNASNLADRRFIASRVDGIQIGRPRQVFVGLRWDF